MVVKSVWRRAEIFPVKIFEDFGRQQQSRLRPFVDSLGCMCRAVLFQISDKLSEGRDLFCLSRHSRIMGAPVPLAFVFEIYHRFTGCKNV